MDHLQDTDTALSTPSFAELGLCEPVYQAVAGLGYETPTPVQAQCIPHLLEGRDLLGQAQTGTGKTAAFALPLLCRVRVDLDLPQLLVLTPTRELALQVAEAFQDYAARLSEFHILPIYGGQSYSLQIRQLKRRPQVIVGTPGRVMDHMRRGNLSLDGLRAIVLDEADEMLNMGFAEDIDWVFEHCPDGVQTALFSATMPEAIKRVAHQRLTDPIEVRVRASAETVDTIDQHHCMVARGHKLDALTRLLEMENFDGMVIFVRTKNATTELADKLKAHGFAAEALNGDMNQELRERTIGRLKDGQLDILIATDVAARGLDVERLSHVINYDIPTDPAAYVHRIGRTGRAGRAGRAILLIEPRERSLLRAIERTIRRNIPAMDPPSAAALSASRIERFTEELRKTLSDQDLDFFYRLVARLSKEQELDPMDMAAALCFLLQRERPLEVEDKRLTPPPGRDRDRYREHDGQPPRSRRERGPRSDDELLLSYRIEVGHSHGVTPREIVGAIANEAGLEGRRIGRIDIRDQYSIVDLPPGMPKEIFQHLQRVYVCGQALRIRESDEPPGRARSGPPGKHGNHTRGRGDAPNGSGRRPGSKAKNRDDRH